MIKKTVLVFTFSLGALLIANGARAQSQEKEKAPKMEQIEKNTTRLELKVEGMSCQSGCANGIDNMLKKQKGILSSETLFDTSSSVIRYDSRVISEKDIIALIEDRGFKVKKKTDKK
ncbi:cation transporter [Echinicola marina]|uniref:cation transporter n=1 Tax=Echinicola marina TaxID=2859768 RepID=UPI001CF66F26|nr:heavy metal-associated domain-containing protein [Echinicola marina]UCS92214.1 cation transporter [Echinicola marina]